MKPLLCLTMFIVFGCEQKPPAPQNNPPAAGTTGKISKAGRALPRTKRGRNIYHTNKDTVYIPTSYEDTLVYSREEFNDIIDYFPELYQANVTHPDKTFSESRVWVDLVDSLGNEDRITFGSEAGQDLYYTLYAHFLKMKNGVEANAVRRKKLMEIYRTINDLFGRLYYGGTFYGHQYKRIEGYAEYDIYRSIHKKALFENPKNFRFQKAQFITALRQNAGSEVSKDAYLITDKEKKERLQELNKDIDYLNKEVTDYYFLETARSFQKSYYQ